MRKLANDRRSAASAICISNRQRRLLRVLMRGRWVSRERVDAVTGASNGPGEVYKLRQKGLKIRMERVRRRDRDGQWCMPGRYMLSPSSMPMARKMLGGV